MRPLLIAIVTLVLATAIIGCAAVSEKESVPARHPGGLDPGRFDCLECHDDSVSGSLKQYGTFNHTLVFVREHGLYAAQGQNLCSACHAAEFCQACHANEEELLPSIKLGDRPDRTLPHRGDYIVQHQIDGRVDPGSCLPCHGRRNDETCVRCHK